MILGIVNFLCYAFVSFASPQPSGSVCVPVLSVIVDFPLAQAVVPAPVVGSSLSLVLGQQRPANLPSCIRR